MVPREPESAFGVFENMTTAFFRMSRSSRAISSSRRRRRFSSSRGFWCPIPGKDSSGSAGSLRHVRIAPCYSPRSRSTCRSVTSPASTIRTASRLKSASYVFFGFPFIDTPPDRRYKGSRCVRNFKTPQPAFPLLQHSNTPLHQQSRLFLVPKSNGLQPPETFAV